MTMGYHPDASVMQDRIRARYQTTFWKEFLRYFDNFGSEAHKLEVLKDFETVFVRLID